MESLKESLSEMMAMFHERMTNFEAELQKAPSTTPSTVSLSTDFAAFKSFILEALGCLHRQMEILASTVDTLEMRSRRKILLLHGVPEHKKEETEDVVKKIIKDSLIISDFTDSDIRRCHRMGRPSSTHKPRPILLKLQSVAVKNKIWFSKTKLKNSGVTMSEFLTRARHNTFMVAREQFGVEKCWTREGFVFILAPDGSRQRITTLADLNKYKHEGTIKQTVTTKTVAKTKRATTKK